ncbi:MAG: 4Fe-4S dicluster domain-containing protein [Psychrilyobacter sp.]|nr:4Fe-4S dicluster domain-containing protein [Psychrilyobacter sp.]
MKKILKSNLPELWKELSEKFNLFLPIEKRNTLNFLPWKTGEIVNLEKVRTNGSPKNLIMPQTETYLKFKCQGKKLSFEAVEEPISEYVLFGVRPCDVNSFTLLDNVFLKEPVDTFYREHRNKGLIISLACNNPDDTCFCSAFDIHPEEEILGADIAAWDLGEYLVFKGKTEKGELLIKSLENLLEEFEDEKKLIEIKESIKKEIEDLPYSNLDLKNIKESLLEIFEKEEVWEEFSKTCLGCGACTFVCPTCHCYDLLDYNASTCGEKFRCWDSCMTSDFTKMAHGNPRETQLQRLRQRFMHKLVYYPNNHDGTYLCVGCGRCVDKCPVHIDIVKIIKKLGGEKDGM